jgi:hypothetical protein
MVRNRQFVWGLCAGALIALLGLRLLAPEPLSGATPAAEALGFWLAINLGHAAWLFALIFALYLHHLRQLRQRLAADPDRDAPDMNAVVELDQLSDVWIHLFIGVGVIWTAIGMRAALQAALGDPDGTFTDTAGSVLQKLVDGGILLALTTTIVGGIGGYLMRLGKTLFVGADLHASYQAAEHQDLRLLLTAVERVEARLKATDSVEATRQPPEHPAFASVEAR